MTLPSPDWILSVDLGQAQDFSCVVILERRWEQVQGGRRLLPHAAIRHIFRWPLQTPYPVITRDLCELVKRPPLRQPPVCLDITGVGRAVYDAVKEARPAATLEPILITGGHNAERAPDGIWHVSKVTLVGTLQMFLQSRRLKIADLPERPALVEELAAFRAKTTAAGNETFGAAEPWRDGSAHDDMVLATAMGCWFASLPVNTARPAAYGGQGRPPALEGALYGNRFGAAAAGGWRPPGAAGLPGGLPFGGDA
jgi:hypothetical protein